MKLLDGCLMVLMLSACSGRAPGDPFGLVRPEELVTICHLELPAVPGQGLPPESRTARFNRSTARWHLRHHEWDYPGVCR